ncbi:NAD(P) transhydrogenase subunit alpha [Arthrobacter tumbae]|nr:NAD(P) transhydrogenase subunit alpha [Arthrobacter tumbae]
MGVKRETRAGERRVAATPASVRQLMKLGLDIAVESDAGVQAGHDDAAYRTSGADVVARLGHVDVLCHVAPLTPDEASALRPGTITVGFASPAAELPTVSALAQAGVASFALELIPRISRAQTMDALSSQSLVAGYRAVLEAAIRFPRFFPLYMTAAGTVPPARVLVLGAGVAGLQAIGTAKRLGARVSAYDVRPASADEVASLGGSFINLDLDAIEGSGGYAREMSQDRAARQRELLAPHVAASDVLITTAAVPGRPAPLLVTTDMVAGMKGGAVVVDLAAETGGNVEGVKAGHDVAVPGVGGTVTLVGMKDAASAMATDASRLFAANVANLVELMTVDGRVVPDFNDDVVSAACLTHDGRVMHQPTAALLKGVP